MKRLFLFLLLFAGSLHVAAAQRTIFVVRHAEKMTDRSDANDPSLSDVGRARAEALATALKDVRITAVYATEFKRTQETAAPSARAAGVEVTVIPGSERAALIEKLKSGNGNALVVAHSNTVPEILNGLGIAAQIAIADADYDNLFVVTLDGEPRLLRLHYR
jgi:broad specificity phosphatase PhoE